MTSVGQEARVFENSKLTTLEVSTQGYDATSFSIKESNK